MNLVGRWSITGSSMSHGCPEFSELRFRQTFRESLPLERIGMGQERKIPFSGPDFDGPGQERTVQSHSLPHHTLAVGTETNDDGCRRDLEQRFEVPLRAFLEGFPHACFLLRAAVHDFRERIVNARSGLIRRYIQ